MIELNYGEVLYNVTKRLEDPQIQKGVAEFENCKNTTSAVEHERTLEHKMIEGKTWSHSVQFGITGSLQIDQKVPMG